MPSFFKTELATITDTVLLIQKQSGVSGRDFDASSYVGEFYIGFISFGTGSLSQERPHTFLWGF